MDSFDFLGKIDPETVNFTFCNFSVSDSFHAFQGQIDQVANRFFLTLINYIEVSPAVFSTGAKEKGGLPATPPNPRNQFSAIRLPGINEVREDMKNLVKQSQNWSSPCHISSFAVFEWLRSLFSPSSGTIIHCGKKIWRNHKTSSGILPCRNSGE